MSRIGKLPIPVPTGVKVEINNNHVKVEGPKGTLARSLPGQIAIRVEQTPEAGLAGTPGGAVIICERPTDSREHRSMHGLTRTLVANMVTGVSQGFAKHLDLVGVGYRAQLQGKDLVLNLGFSHPVKVTPPAGVSIEVTDPTHLSVVGASAEAVGQLAANIRRIRPPEPYKGKGVLYRGERLRRKAGKTGKGK